jgi:hypothetical protein
MIHYTINSNCAVKTGSTLNWSPNNAWQVCTLLDHFVSADYSRTIWILKSQQSWLILKFPILLLWLRHTAKTSSTNTKQMKQTWRNDYNVQMTPSMSVVSRCWMSVLTKAISCRALSSIACGLITRLRRQFGAMTIDRLFISILFIVTFSGAANTYLHSEQNSRMRNEMKWLAGKEPSESLLIRHCLYLLRNQVSQQI